MPSNFIADISETPDGEIILSSEKGISSFDGEKFQKVSNKLNTSIFSTSDSKQYYTQENKLFELGNDKQAIISLPNQEEIIGAKYWNNNWCILTQKSIYIFSKGIQKKRISFTDYALKNILLNDQFFIVTTSGISELTSSFQIKPIIKASDWISNAAIIGNEIFLFSQKQIRVYSLKTKTIVREELIKNGLQIIQLQSKKCLLLTKDTVYLYSTNECIALQNESFKKHAISSIKQTQNGVVWFLTEGKGIYYVPNSNQLIYQNNLKVTSLIDFENTIFLGTKTGLIPTTTIPQEKKLFQGKTVNSLTKHAKTFYVALNDGCYALTSQGKSKLTTESLKNLVITTDGATLYGSTNSRGIWKFDLQSKKESFISIADGLSHNGVNAMCLIADTLLVLPEKGKMNFIVDGKVIAHTLESKLINRQFKQAIYQANRLFLLDANGTLIVTNLSGTAIKTIHLNHLSSNMYLFEDQLILIGLQELSTYAISTGITETRGLSSQLSGLEYSENSVVKNNILFIGTSKGYVTFTSDYFKKSTVSTTRIQHLRVNGKPIAVQEKIALPYGTYRLNISLSSANFHDNGSKKYFWKMTHYSNHFSPLEDEELDLFQLTEGTYQLTIKTSDHSETIETWITIAKPFWKQTWFLVTSFIFLILLFISILQLRTSKLKKDTIRLNQLVEIRTKELNERNQEMTAVSHAISHDVLTPLKTIKQLAELQSNPVFPESAKKEGLGFLQQTATNVVSNVTGLIGFLNLETEQDQSEWVHFTTLLEDIRTLILAQYNDSNAFLCVDIQCDKIQVNKSFITSIFQNLISNSIKYSKKGIFPRMHVRILREKDFVVIEIEDNGIGMDLSKFGNDLFTPFRQVDSRSAGFGLGLSIVFKMIKKINGIINVESELGKGTIWRIELPFSAEKPFTLKD